MPKIEVRHRPDLDVQDLLGLLQDYFSPRYEVYETALIGADIVLRKSAWSGLSIKLIQKADKTLIRFGGMSPSVWVRMLQMGLIPLLILYLTSWKQLQQELESYLTTAPELS